MPSYNYTRSGRGMASDEYGVDYEPYKDRVFKFDAWRCVDCGFWLTDERLCLNHASVHGHHVRYVLAGERA